MNFREGIGSGIALRLLLKKNLNSLKANSFWELLENRGSSNLVARNVNTGGEIEAVLQSTELSVSADKEESPVTFSMEAATCNSSHWAASLVRHSSSKFSSCIMAAVVCSSIQSPSPTHAHSPPVSGSAPIWLHCEKPAPSKCTASPAAGPLPPHESD